jgi:hypothetical protein
VDLPDLRTFADCSGRSLASARPSVERCRRGGARVARDRLAAAAGGAECDAHERGRGRRAHGLPRGAHGCLCAHVRVRACPRGGCVRASVRRTRTQARQAATIRSARPSGTTTHPRGQRTALPKRAEPPRASGRKDVRPHAHQRTHQRRHAHARAHARAGSARRHSATQSQRHSSARGYAVGTAAESSPVQAWRGVPRRRRCAVGRLPRGTRTEPAGPKAALRRRTAAAMRSDVRRLCAAALQRFRMPRPHLRRDRARPCHICTETALTPCSRFAPGLGLTPRHVGAYRVVILVGDGAQRTDVLAPWALRRLRNAEVDETCAAPRLHPRWRRTQL